MSGINRIERLKLFLDKDPDDAFLNYALAMEFLASMKYAEARSQLEMVLDLNPDYIPVYYQLGKLLSLLGFQEDAIQIYKTGIEKCKIARDFKTASELNTALEELED